jgi:hypothetical protein
MTASAVRSPQIPVPRTPSDPAAGRRVGSPDRPVPTPREAPAPSAVAYQVVLHQLVRRELRLLAELSTWAAADDGARSAALTQHADLIGRVMLHHHAAERELLWPALLQATPAERETELRTAVLAWTDRCRRIDHMLRDVSTAARQWAVAGTCPARDRFAMACLDLADAVDAHTDAEERTLLPLVAAHLDAGAWAAIIRQARCPLTPREQLLVVGLALEDTPEADRARLVEGLPRSWRVAWKLLGTRRYRAAVVRLRGAPPAA